MSYKYLVDSNSTNLTTVHALKLTIQTPVMFQAMLLTTHGFNLIGIGLHSLPITAAFCLMLGCRTSLSFG